MNALPISAFSGELLRPGAPDYDRARRVWNGAIDRRPAFIARCRSTRDVVSVVDHARQSGLTVSIRGSGHHYGGLAVWDDALVIDLSAMKAISLDTERRTVAVQSGVTWGELDAAAQEHGLATTGANSPGVGVAGCTLAGGIGWLHRVAGLSCDNLLSAEVVTATGQVLRAAPDEHDDLFWALRGGGGNFGVVTSLEFRLHPVGEVLGGLAVHPYERAHDALRLYHELCEGAPDELFLRAMLVTAPPAPFVPTELRGHPAVVLLAAYFGPRDEGEQALRPLRELGTPAVDMIQPRSYAGLQRVTEEALSGDIRVSARTEWLAGLPGDVIEALVAGAAKTPSPVTTVILQQLGGAMSRVPEASTAFAWRGAAYHLGVVGLWPPEGPPEPTIEWVRSMWERALPASAGGGYSANLMDAGSDRVRASYGAHYGLLARLKARYDPDNFFRINPNIEPDPEGAAT